MYRIYSALIEIVAAAVFIIPIWCIYNKLCFHSWKRTIIYMVFGLSLIHIQMCIRDRPYIMAFYIRGLMAIISEWLKNDCADSITYVTGVIQQCVKMPQSETMNDV